MLTVFPLLGCLDYKLMCIHCYVNLLHYAKFIIKVYYYYILLYCIITQLVTNVCCFQHTYASLALKWKEHSWLS